MQGSQLQQSLNEKRIDPVGVSDCWAIYNDIPNVKVARDAFASVIFCAPFHVKAQSIPLRQTKEVDVLVEQHWLKWQNLVYDC